MKILHLANTPLSNSPANIASCQNYVGHEARLLLANKTGRNKVFVGGETWKDKPMEEIASIFEWADVIHFHNFTWTQDIFRQHLPLQKIARAKKFVVQFHSSRRAHEDFEDTVNDPLFKGRKLVVAQYQPREYPEAEWIVPNPLPLHEDRYRLIRKGKWGDCPPICVSFAPSNGHLKGWDYKGYDQLEPVMRHLAHWGASTDLILSTPYEECLTRKSYAHIGIEEFFTGSYHLSLLEYMALECASFGHMDELTRKALISVVGEDAFRQMPYLDITNTRDLIDGVRRLNSDLGDLKRIAQLSRLWIHAHWCPRVLMKIYDKVYESL